MKTSQNCKDLNNLNASILLYIKKGLGYLYFDPIDKPLTGMKLLAVGKLTKNKDDVKAAVEELGGKITGTASKASLCLSTKSE